MQNRSTKCGKRIAVAEPIHTPTDALPWLHHRSSKKGQAKPGAATPGRAGSKPALKKAQKGSAAPVHVVDVVEEAVQGPEQVRDGQGRVHPE